MKRFESINDVLEFRGKTQGDFSAIVNLDMHVEVLQAGISLGDSFLKKNGIKLLGTSAVLYARKQQLELLQQFFGPSAS